MYKTESGREISFLGAGMPAIRASKLQYGELTSLDQLFEKLADSAWGKDTTCKECEASYDHSQNPSEGQCSITAALVQDIFGGDIIRVSFADGDTHFCNCIGKEYIDLSSDQFAIRGADSLAGKREVVERNDCLRDMNYVMKYNLLSIKLCKAVAKDLAAKYHSYAQRATLPVYENGDDIPSYLNALEHSLKSQTPFADSHYYSKIGERSKIADTIKKAESASFALIKFTRLSSGQTLMTAASVATQPNARQLMLNDSIYKKSGLICEAEQQELLELIQIIRSKNA